MKESLQLVDIFSGAGGLSYGFQETCYNILTAIDNDPNCVETYSNNIKTKYKPLLKSILEIQPEELLEYIKMSSGELDLLIGGPPCRGFSNANRQNRKKNNIFNQLIFQYLNFIESIKPKVFLFENVLGLIPFDKGNFFENFINKIKKSKYIINQFIFNCENFGIPQKRERLIVIGTRKRKKINFNFKEEDKVNVQQAIDDLPDLENGNINEPLFYKENNNLSNFQKEMRKNNKLGLVFNNLVTKNNDLVISRYKYIKQGCNWSSIPKNLMKNYSNIRNCHSSIYFRLEFNKPSITLCNFRKNMIIHPIQHRGLSVREAARLQSFPDNFIFKGGISSQQQQVANAVPPKLSKQLAKSIIDFLNK